MYSVGRFWGWGWRGGGGVGERVEVLGRGLFWSAALQFSEIICQSELGWRDRKREEERKNYVIGSVVAWVRLVG